MAANPRITALNRAAKERARKFSAEADLKEMERDKLRGQLVDVDRFSHALMAAFGRVREKLIAFPSRVAPEMIGLKSEAEAEAILDRYILEAMAELRDQEIPEDD
jgi:hypothetical protein